MYPLEFERRSSSRDDSAWKSLDDWAGGRQEPDPDPEDRDPTEDPRWPYITPSFPKRPYRMSEEEEDGMKPPRSPKKAWGERPPKSPKEITEQDNPRSPKAPIRGYRAYGGNCC